MDCDQRRYDRLRSEAVPSVLGDGMALIGRPMIVVRCYPPRVRVCVHISSCTSYRVSLRFASVSNSACSTNPTHPTIAFALAAPPALVAPAVVLTAIALPLPLALDPCSCSRRHGVRAPRRGEPPIGELPRAPVASALHRPRSRGHPLPVVASASHQPRSHGHPLPLVASGLHRPRSRGHPLPLWHRRCTAPARTVTLCP